MTRYSPAERVPVAVGEVVEVAACEVVEVAVSEGVDVVEGGIPVDAGVPGGPDVGARVGGGGYAVAPGKVVSD